MAEVLRKTPYLAKKERKTLTEELPKVSVASDTISRKKKKRKP
jgi:hypothetical protein